MWTNGGKNKFPCRGFTTPPPSWKSRNFRSPKTAAFSERKRSFPSPNSANKSDLFHVIHKVPAGDSPYVKAKQVQLIDKDPSRSVSMFWAAINAGDRVDSALKDMAVVMKQLDRSEEAIEAIRSFRHLCPCDSQESIDNVLIELYKRSGRIEEEIDMLQSKLRQIDDGTVFGGKRTKPARSQGKKVQITIEQEKSRVLGNLAWAFLQLDNFYVAEDFYRKALSLESDNNKKCNLAICLILTNRLTEAKSLLQSVKASSGGKPMEESYAKSFERASHMLAEKESNSSLNLRGPEADNSTVTTITSKSSTVRDMLSVSPQVTASSKWTSHDEEMYVNENSRGDDHWESYENKSVGATNSSHNYLHCNKWIEGCCKSNTGIPIETKGTQNQDGLLKVVDESLTSSSSYSSPISAGQIVEVPFTQPKNPFWELNIRHWPKERMQQKGKTGGSSSRKLLFDNPSMKDQSLINGFSADASSESEGIETIPTLNYKTKYSSAASGTAELEVPFTQPRSSWGINRGDCHTRKATECYRGLPGSSSRKLSFEPPTSTKHIQRSELSRAVSDECQDLDADWEQISCGHIEYEEIAMPYNLRKMKEEHIAVDKKFKHNSSTIDEKKSWADMVEEEEEDGDDEKEGATTEETSSSGRGTHVNYFGGDWSSSSDNEELNGIKFDSVDIKDGTKDTVEAVPSRNPAVRRPLYFDQQHMLDSLDNYRSSLMPRKDLTTEISCNSVPTMAGENENLIRKNRLQIFQSITVHQDQEC